MNILSLLFGLTFCLSNNLAVSLSTKDEVFTSQGLFRLPSHIVKLKSSSIINTADFEPTSFIKNHYTAFKKISQSSLQGNMETAGHGKKHKKKILEPKALKSVNLGKDFTTVIGQLDPYFVHYLSQLEDVEYVEPNRIYRPAIMPINKKPRPYEHKHVKKHGKHHKKHDRRDSIIPNMITQIDVPSWGLSRINQRTLGDLTAYTVDESAGNGVHVYVFDSGLDPDHPDFGDRAISDANFIFYEDGVDYSGHGTHVAGTIGGNTYGVAKSTVLHAVKILDRNGDGTAAAFLEALAYVSKVAPPGRSIINLSLTGPRSPTIDNALSMVVHQHGIPVFASAGNEGDNACNYSPAANPDVFTVGASDENDNVASFSAFGPCVRLYAPGTNITSSWINDESLTLDGTSMANPHVTGIAAMLLSKNNYNHPFDLYEDILSQATLDVLHFSEDGESRLKLAYTGIDSL